MNIFAYNLNHSAVRSLKYLLNFLAKILDLLTEFIDFITKLLWLLIALSTTAAWTYLDIVLCVQISSDYSEYYYNN